MTDVLIKNANANRYWTKVMQPVYPDSNIATDGGSIVELGFIVEANFLIEPELIKTILDGINTRCVHNVSRQRVPFRHNFDCKRVFPQIQMRL